jgi:DNA-binding MarR family transcriptional regulator
MTPRERNGDRDVNYELVRFVRRTRAYANEHLADIHPELDYNTFVILLAVHDAPNGVRASDLVGDLFVHKSTISRAVSTLERLGLLDRVTHPDDGRAQLLSVPHEARERIEAFRSRSYGWLGNLVADWAPDELTTFASQLSRLNDAAEKNS